MRPEAGSAKLEATDRQGSGTREYSLASKTVYTSVKLDILTAVLDVLVVDAYKLSNRMKVARAERGLSQDQLAQLVGVTRQTISAIETGLYCPSALLAFRLAMTLGKRVDELFFLEGVPV
jgi:putative transcriptional regulator